MFTSVAVATPVTLTKICIGNFLFFWLSIHTVVPTGCFRNSVRHVRTSSRGKLHRSKSESHTNFGGRFLFQSVSYAADFLKRVFSNWTDILTQSFHFDYVENFRSERWIIASRINSLYSRLKLEYEPRHNGQTLCHTQLLLQGWRAIQLNWWIDKCIICCVSDRILI